MSPSADACRPTSRRPTDATEYLRFHTARGYYLKRNAVALCLVFIWVTSLVGIYSFDLWLLTPILLGAVGAWAALRRQYARFRDKAHYFLAVAVIDNLFITAAVYALVGAGSAGGPGLSAGSIFFPLFSRPPNEIYLVANIAGSSHKAKLGLECL